MIDKEKVAAGVRLILEGIGEDLERDGLLETPKRIAKMYEEVLSGMEETADTHLQKCFKVATAEVVLEKDITFYSMCEHHMLPFYGKAHIAYIPNGEVVGLSKIARVVEVYAKRLQIQEQMTTQIAESFMKYLKPQGVMVMLEAEHMCMTMRGVKNVGAKTVTVTTRGIFETDKDLRDSFYQMIHG